MNFLFPVLLLIENLPSLHEGKKKILREKTNSKHITDAQK